MATGNSSEFHLSESAPRHGNAPGDGDIKSDRFHPLGFSGMATAFFKIHFVNLLLTIITMGFYAPWARVRHRRYFYSNTRIMGEGLDYLARGRDLLLGWCIAVALIIVYNLIPLIDEEIPYLQLS